MISNGAWLCWSFIVSKAFSFKGSVQFLNPHSLFQASKLTTNLLIAEFLSEGGHEVAKLGRADEPVAVFVEVPQALYEVLRGVGAVARADGLKLV